MNPSSLASMAVSRCNSRPVTFGGGKSIVNKGGRITGEGISDEKAVWQMVFKYAKATSLGKLAPHDLRRTCAKLCRKAGGDLEQIQMLLGHASIQTTERYLGTEQNLAAAVNDALGLEQE